MKLPRLLRTDTLGSKSHEQTEQESALLRTGGDPSLLIAMGALRHSWEENALERAQKLAHDRGVQDGTITELFPTQPETNHASLESRVEPFDPRLKHVKIILPQMVKVELFDQDSDIV